jgi:hypothetical protein
MIPTASEARFSNRRHQLQGPVANSSIGVGTKWPGVLELHSRRIISRLLARLVPRTLLVAVVGLVAPVLAQEENRNGQHPIAVKANIDIDFIFLTFVNLKV